MTIRAARQDTEPGRLQRSRIGLFEAGVFDALPGDVLERLSVGGVGYQAYTPGAPTDNTYDPCTATADIALDEGSIVEWNAYPVSVGEECLTLSDQDGERSRQRAIDRLTAQFSHLGEHVFWTGEVGPTDTFASLTWPNRQLASTTVTDLTPGAAPVGVVLGFSLLIRYLADTLGGLRGVIHMPVDVIPYASHYRTVVRTGTNTLGTAIADHVVIAGTGYPGTAPDGVAAAAGTTWMYATSMIRTGITPINDYMAIDRANNKAQAIATRTLLAEWDQEAHAAIQVCLIDPGPACP